MDKLHCEFDKCVAEDTLIVAVQHEDRLWGLCPLHEKIVEQNGASVVTRGGKKFLTAPKWTP